MAGNYRTLREVDAEDVDGKVAAVRALLNSPVNENKIILVVEGSDDVDVYGSLFDSSKVELYPDGNCDKHVVILSALNHLASRLVAIKDADFDHLNGLAPRFSNLFLTDKHDLEGMILFEGIPDSVVKKYYHRCSDIDINQVYRDLICISYLRWMNHERGLMLDFKRQKWSSHYAFPYVIDVDNYISCLLRDSSMAHPVTRIELEAFISDSGRQDVTQLVRGHDLMHCLYIRAKDKDKSNFSQGKFFKDVRNSYTIDRFKNSNLYLSLVSYSPLLVCNSKD